jgi:hypothetical protein
MEDRVRRFPSIVIEWITTGREVSCALPDELTLAVEGELKMKRKKNRRKPIAGDPFTMETNILMNQMLR